MANKKVEKARIASREVKTPVFGNLDKEQRFIFDKKDENVYVIAKVPRRTVKIGRESKTNEYFELARVFKLTEDDFDELYVQDERYKSSQNTLYVVLHDPTKGPAVKASNDATRDAKPLGYEDKEPKGEVKTAGVKPATDKTADEDGQTKPEKSETNKDAKK